MKSKMVGVFIVFFLMFSPLNGSNALVVHQPVQPSHEEHIVIDYLPEPTDNTTTVKLRHTLNGDTQDDIVLVADPITGRYTQDLGLFYPGTDIEYWVLAWNKTVGHGNISIGSVVEVRWHRDIEEGDSLAYELERPVLMFFYSDGDKDGFKMDMETFSDEAVLNLSAEFVAIRVNVDQDPFAANKTKVLETPSVVFFDNGSKEVHRFIGYRTGPQMVTHMNYALGKGPRPDEGRKPATPLVSHYLILIILSFLVIVGVIFILLRLYHKRI